MRKQYETCIGTLGGQNTIKMRLSYEKISWLK